MELNLNTWKEFKIGDIFKKQKIKKFSSTPIESGDIPFISSTSFDNGVSSFCNELPIDGNCITVSTNGHCFDCFYHESPIVVSSDVEVLYNENLNRNNALFICTILHRESIKWQYGRKPKNDKVFQTTIKLPAIDEKTPNWDFMTEYIKEIVERESKNRSSIVKSLETKNKSRIGKVDTSNWKKFKIGDLFEIHKAKSTNYVELNSIENFKNDRNYPYVTRTNENNGVTVFSNDNDKTIENGYCLTIGDTTATCFFQKNNFISGDHIVILRNSNISKYALLFMVTIINLEKVRYAYGRAFKMNFIKNTIIKLPATEDGKPNYEYMDSYIKSLPYGDMI